MIQFAFAVLILIQVDSFTLESVSKNVQVIRFDGKIHGGFVIGHLTVGKTRSVAFGVVVRGNRIYAEDEIGRAFDGDYGTGEIRLRE